MSIDLLKMDNLTLDKRYNFLSKEIDQEKLTSYFDDPDIAKAVFADPLIAKTLQDEFNQIRDDRETLRNSIFRLNTDDMVHLPVNLHRIIKNAKRMFEITNRSKTDLKPTDVISKLGECLQNLCVVPGIDKRSDRLLQGANQDSTLLTRIYLKSILNSKNVIMNERLNS